MGCMNGKNNANQQITKYKCENMVANKRKFEENTSSFWNSQSQISGLPPCQRGESTISSVENIYYYYRFLKKLGNGSFGSVMLAQQIQAPYNKVAIKIIKKNNLIGPPSCYIKREVDIIKGLDHPNICNFLETYMDKDYIYLVMEYLSGGTLNQKLQNKEVLTEYQISIIMKKLFWAINYLHTCNILHRDLKLDNIVYTSSNQHAEIKIIDFGLSKKFNIHSSRKRHTQVGSPLYMAPEILLSQNYERECDVWSLGVIMYYLLSRELPFMNLDQIKKGRLLFNAPAWKKVSNEAKHLIRSILIINPINRIKLNEAITHKWFNIMDRQKQKNYKDIAYINQVELGQKLIQFRMDNQFKRDVVMIMVKRISDKTKTKLKDIFCQIDQDKNGVITTDELRNYLQKQLCQNDTVNVEQIIHKISGNNKKSNIILDQGVQTNIYISYSEFIAATLHENLYLNRKNLQQCFNYLNSTETGYITKQDIQDFMAREGRKLTDIQFKELYEAIYKFCSNSGKLDFDNFYKMMIFENRFVQQNSIQEEEEDEEEEGEDINITMVV